MLHDQHNYEMLDAWLKEMNASGHRVALVIGLDPKGRAKISAVEMPRDKLVEILETSANAARSNSATKKSF